MLDKRNMAHGLARISTDYKISSQTKKSVKIREIRGQILFLILLILCIPIFAQESQQNYYISHDDGVFVQRLTWQHTDHISHFVVIIEQLVRDNYREIERSQTEDNFIEVTLQVGRYRYRVEVYDLLDDLFHTTNWREFEIMRAYQPEVSSLSPGGFYLDEDDTWVVTVRGNYLFENSVYYLVRGNIIIYPESFTAERNYARLTFSENSLIPGRYDIYVKNPGGLDTQYGTFTIGYRKPFDFNISLSYSPLFPVLGFHFKDGELQAPFPDFVYPLSGGARMSLVPFKRPWGYVGAEFTGSFSYLQNKKEFFSTEGYLINAHLSLLYQLYFMKKTISLNAGLGAGVSYLMNTVYRYPTGSPTEEYKSFYPSVMANLSFTAFFKKPFFITAGADYIHMFIPPEDGNMAGFVRPFISVGVQF